MGKRVLFVDIPTNTVLDEYPSIKDCAEDMGVSKCAMEGMIRTAYTMDRDDQVFILKEDYLSRNAHKPIDIVKNFANTKGISKMMITHDEAVNICESYADLQKMLQIACKELEGKYHLNADQWLCHLQREII